MPGYENNNRTAILQGLGRCKIKKVTSTTPFMSGITESLPEEVDTDKDPEFTTAVEDMKLVAKEYIQESDDIPDDTQFAIDNLKNHFCQLHMFYRAFSCKRQNITLTGEFHKRQII